MCDKRPFVKDLAFPSQLVQLPVPFLVETDIWKLA